MHNHSNGEFIVIRRSTFISLPAAILLLFASVLAVAQHNGGRDEYQILQARYGTADRNIDVTARLKELARQDATFRMGNSTFGTDPDPGRVKTLRIYTRARNGQKPRSTRSSAAAARRRSARGSAASPRPTR